MAKIDYGVGDLVVCVRASGKNPNRVGEVYTCVKFLPEDSNGERGVLLAEIKSRHPSGGLKASAFRKLPKKSQEFFAGEKQVVKDLVPAE